jgi:hypothetical protein
LIGPPGRTVSIRSVSHFTSPLPPAEPPTRIPHPNSDRPRLTPPYHSPPRRRPPDVTAKFLPSSTTAPIHHQRPIPERHQFLFQPSASDRQGQSPGPRLPGPRNDRCHCRGSLPLCVRPVHSSNKLFASHLSPAAFDFPISPNRTLWPSKAHRQFGFFTDYHFSEMHDTHSRPFQQRPLLTDLSFLRSFLSLFSLCYSSIPPSFSFLLFMISFLF